MKNDGTLEPCDSANCIGIVFYPDIQIILNFTLGIDLGCRRRTAKSKTGPTLCGDIAGQ